MAIVVICLLSSGQNTAQTATQYVRVPSDGNLIKAQPEDLRRAAPSPSPSPSPSVKSSSSVPASATQNDLQPPNATSTSTSTSKQMASPASNTTTASVADVESIDILKQNQAERSRDQPGNAAPTFRIIKEGTKNYSSLPDPEAGILVQPKQRFPWQSRATTAGEAWRNYRNGPLTYFGGWILLISLAGIVLIALIFLNKRKTFFSDEPLIERFTLIERVAHWSTGVSFVLLVLSGSILMFGRYFMMPLMGHFLFGWLGFLCKNIHHFVGPIFTLSVVFTFILFVKDNLPIKEDWQWFFQLGGWFGSERAHAGRFDAGEKCWFWIGLVVLSLSISVSGWVLDMLVPGMNYSRGNMQIAHVAHVVGAVLMTAMSLPHIYFGTIGVDGALKGMTSGFVSEQWAQRHHDLWFEQIKSGMVARMRTLNGTKTSTVNRESS